MVKKSSEYFTHFFSFIIIQAIYFGKYYARTSTSLIFKTIKFFKDT